LGLQDLQEMCKIEYKRGKKMVVQKCRWGDLESLFRLCGKCIRFFVVHEKCTRTKGTCCALASCVSQIVSLTQ
jgi:hypothetical protein